MQRGIEIDAQAVHDEAFVIADKAIPMGWQRVAPDIERLMILETVVGIREIGKHENVIHLEDVGRGGFGRCGWSGELRLYRLTPLKPSEPQIVFERIDTCGTNIPVASEIV